MLVLPIKKQWFDMIKSGEKLEEYREIKPYYRTRFYNIGLVDVYGLPIANEVWVIFRNGYSDNSPSFSAKVSLDINKGHVDWGAEKDKEYYVLKILDII